MRSATYAMAMMAISLTATAGGPEGETSASFLQQRPAALDAAVESKLRTQLDGIDFVMNAHLAGSLAQGRSSGLTIVSAEAPAQPQ